MDAAPRPTLPLLDDLNAVTRDLSRFAGSAAGLGSVLGGTLCLISYVAHGAVSSPLPVSARLTLAGFPLAWIAFKELLRRRYYQQYGLAVPPPPSRSERITATFCFLFTCVISAGVTAAVILAARPWTLEKIGYLAFVLILPACVLLFRSAEEFIVGVFLICQAAVGIAGHRYRFSDGYTVIFPIASVALILIGARQHRLFLTARRRLFDLRTRLPQETA